MANRDREASSGRPDVDSNTVGSLVAGIRREYSETPLREADCCSEPYLQLERWLKEAVGAQLVEPNVMVLATVGSDGAPSARAVLLKDLTSHGMVFFSNYQSRKALEISASPRVAATFVWEELERQVRVEGIVRKVDRKESEAYFHSRPRLSQLASCVSAQSDHLGSREEMELRFGELSSQSVGKPLACPEHWGGYRIVAHRVEFWQGRANRLHDRLVYRSECAKDGSTSWRISRLWP